MISKASCHRYVFGLAISMAVCFLGYGSFKLYDVRLSTKPFPWKAVKQELVNCSKLFNGDVVELHRAKEIKKKNPRVALTNDQVTKLARTCDKLIRERSIFTSSLSEAESNFPLAYSIVVYKDAEQVLNLLSAIYRPQNVYCVHVDAKVKRSYRQAIAAIADCFPNVFLSSRSVDVRWGKFSVLEPELVCMQDLWNYTHWKYFINLTGQEFPLKTNYELVKIFSAYNGAIDNERTRQRIFRDRWSKAGPAPHGLKPWKGGVQIAVNRDFVDFVLHSPVATDLLNWTKRTRIPDELFFSTLIHNPQLGIRGSYKGSGKRENPDRKKSLIRFKNWKRLPYPCAGNKYVRGVCILSEGDLPFLLSRNELFANKFYADYSRFALGCLAERLHNRTRDEHLGKLDYNTDFVQDLDFVKYMVTSPPGNQTSVVS